MSTFNNNANRKAISKSKSKQIQEKTSELASRCIKIDDWIFEVKMVRAIRVEEYGQPYSAIANINFNGDAAYVDGLMTNAEIEFERQDFNSFKKYLQQLGVKQVQFDRYKNLESTSRSFDVPPSVEASPKLKLVLA